MLAALWIAWQGEVARAEELVRVGRVRDACTAAAIEGVEVELWTENELGPPELVAEASTDARGLFALPDSARRGPLRLRHEAYRSHVDAASEEDFVLFPRGAPTVLEVRDLEDAPIAGARLVLTQSSRHAIPTVSVESDSAGRLVVPDMPALRQGGNVTLLAPGWGALALAPTDLEDWPTLFLPRRAPVRLRLLDADDRPLGADTSRYEAEGGGYPLLPDPEGRVELASLFGGEDGGLVLRAFRHGLPPSGPEFVLRCGDALPGPDESWLQVFLDVPIEEERGIPLRSYDEHGYVWEGLTRGTAVMAGKHTLVLGRSFSGIRARLIPLELGRGERRSLDLSVEREPLLRLELPEERGLLHVQAGKDSVSKWAQYGCSTGVPPDVEVIVLFQGKDVRRARLAPWSGETKLDLTDPAFLWKPARPAEKPFEATYRVQSSRGGPLEVSASVENHEHEEVDLDARPDFVRLALPAGRRFEVRLAAAGHEVLFRTGVGGAGGASFEDVTLPLESE